MLAKQPDDRLQRLRQPAHRRFARAPRGRVSPIPIAPCMCQAIFSKPRRVASLHRRPPHAGCRHSRRRFHPDGLRPRQEDLHLRTRGPEDRARSALSRHRRPEAIGNWRSSSSTSAAATIIRAAANTRSTALMRRITRRSSNRRKPLAIASAPCSSTLRWPISPPSRARPITARALTANLGRRDLPQDVCHRRHRLHSLPRTVRRALRAAQSQRMERDLRLLWQHCVEPPHVSAARRRCVYRRDGARSL